MAALALLDIDHQTNVVVRVFSQGLEYTDGLSVTLRTLSQLGPAAGTAVPKIQSLLRADTEQVREWASKALEEIDPLALRASLQEINRQKPEHLARLIHAIKDGNQRECTWALDTLQAYGPDAGDAVPAIMQAADRFVLNSSANSVLGAILGRRIGEALAEIGPGARTAVPQLITLLRADRVNAPAYCLALGKIGPEANDSVPALEELLADENPRAQLAAAVALSQLAPERASNVVAVLRQLQDQPEPELRFPATVALWRLRATPEPPVSLILDWANGVPPSSSRKVAIDLLGEIGPKAKAAIPMLKAALDDREVHVQRDAAIALRKIDPETYEQLDLPGLLALPCFQ